MGFDRLQTLWIALSAMACLWPSGAALASAESCCVCVVDPWDKAYVTAICNDWFGRNKRKTGCSHQFQISKADRTGDERFPSGSSAITCKNVHLYGVFHGKSNEAKVPFQLAAHAARAFKAQKVCYDGVSCLVFDNTRDVEACARSLARSDGCRYEITGNQNIGITSEGGFFCGPREIPGSTSKLTAFIDGLNVQLQYAPCTSEGDKCVFLSKISENYALSKNDPNAKWCTHRGAIVEQRCCISEWMKIQMKYEKSGTGKWSAPGGNCT